MRMLCLVFLLLFAAMPAVASDPPHHHLGAFAGFVSESRPGKSDENGYAAGLVYEFRFHEHWGISGAVEGLGSDFVRNMTIVVPASWHPAGGLRFFAGPGYEFTDKKDEFLVRVGLGYEFHLGGKWTLAPEMMFDYVESDTTIWLAGLVLGYEF